MVHCFFPLYFLGSRAHFRYGVNADDKVLFCLFSFLFCFYFSCLDFSYETKGSREIEKVMFYKLLNPLPPRDDVRKQKKIF